VFEFWQKRYGGSHAVSFSPGELPGKFNSQVFIIRERLDRPQLLATSRHVTGGGTDLVDVRWDENTLSGRSLVVAGDPYTLYVTEPSGWRFDGVQCDGAEALAITRRGIVVEAGCQADSSRELSWRVVFARAGGD
jgi:hypothetical protein